MKERRKKILRSAKNEKIITIKCIKISTLWLYLHHKLFCDEFFRTLFSWKKYFEDLLLYNNCIVSRACTHLWGGFKIAKIRFNLNDCSAFWVVWSILSLSLMNWFVLSCKISDWRLEINVDRWRLMRIIFSISKRN